MRLVGQFAITELLVRYLSLMGNETWIFKTIVYNKSRDLFDMRPLLTFRSSTMLLFTGANFEEITCAEILMKIVQFHISKFHVRG